MVETQKEKKDKIIHKTDLREQKTRKQHRQQ